MFWDGAWKELTQKDKVVSSSEVCKNSRYIKRNNKNGIITRVLNNQNNTFHSDIQFQKTALPRCQFSLQPYIYSFRFNYWTTFKYKEELKIETACFIAVVIPSRLQEKQAFIYTELSTECTEDSYIYKSALI